MVPASVPGHLPVLPPTPTAHPLHRTGSCFPGSQAFWAGLRVTPLCAQSRSRVRHAHPGKG